MAVEIEGGLFARGLDAKGRPKKSRHTTGAGFEKDCEKYNTAQIMGITVYRFPSHWVTSGLALNYLARVFLCDR